MKQNTTILPSKTCVGPGVVYVDIHHCLSQVLTAQYVMNLNPQVKGRICIKKKKNLVKIKMVKAKVLF